MHKWLRPLLEVMALLYPFIIYFGIQSSSISLVAFIGIALLCLRFFYLKKLMLHKGLAFISLFIAAFLIITAAIKSDVLLLLYPIWVNLGFAIVFIYSLYKGPAIVTIIASLKESLDERGIRYTRNVTKAWVGFFIFNGFIAAMTVAFYDEDIWLLYNGIISYMLIGLFFLTELVIRKKFKASKTLN